MWEGHEDSTHSEFGTSDSANQHVHQKHTQNSYSSVTAALSRTHMDAQSDRRDVSPLTTAVSDFCNTEPVAKTFSKT